jgi:uncharacterized protein with PIN domain
MTDELRDRLAAAIDDVATPVTPSEAMSRGKRQVRRRATVAVCATVVAVAVSGVAIAGATTRNASRPARVFIGDGSGASSTSVTMPAYRASETLIILSPAARPLEHARVGPISVVEMRNILVAFMTGEDTARAVAEAGGSAQFRVVRSSEASPLMEVVTTSERRQDANRTLMIVDSMIKQKLVALQSAAGVRAQDMLMCLPVTRHDA